MTTDRRQQILRIYYLALAREGDDRARLLDEACAGDDELRREVESRLAQDPPDEFLQAPAPNAVGVLPLTSESGTLVGQQFGAYRIDSRLGSGGMGEVYRATDTTLGRAVAIKLLPAMVALDPERRARLEREGKSLATLNHPHIAHVYGFQAMPDAANAGVGNALVMELIDGLTLTDVLQKGPLPIDDALRYGAQIADALAAAHAHGIVHRDVKPANVMIGESGVKVLDFGLAKLTGMASDNVETALPHGGGMTGPNTVLGTVSYMSPEQAEGEPVDARSDVFSLGVVLYEMLCGRRPFSGDTAIATLAATLKSAPPRPRVVRKNIPASVERIVLRCLEKAPQARYPSARDVHQALSVQIASRSTRGISRRAALVGAAAVVFITLVGLGVRAYVQASRVRWVETEAGPEIERLLIENRRLAAAALYRTAARYAPTSRVVRTLAEGVEGRKFSVVTTPPGARIYVSDYVAAAGDDLSEWQFMGTSPIATDAIPSWGFYRVRAVMDGFAPAESAHQGIAELVEITLHRQQDTPPGMVWVPPVTSAVPRFLVAPPINLPGFWIDSHEVTNRQYKAFVEAGGYQREEYWKEPFVKDGRVLSWRDAVAEFRDATNRPGPASWRLGTYPEGTEDLPVDGVSWYEATAYATFAGKSLPTLHEWWGAAHTSSAANSDILTLSNFGGDGPEPAGANKGVAAFGAYDMAGNVKEWAANSDSSMRRYLLGGSWSEDSYVFTAAEPRSPFSRESTHGFRCVRRITSPPADSLQSYDKPRANPRRAPVDDATFKAFMSLHAYDRTDLEANIEHVDDSSPYWRRETVSFRAGHGNDRVLAHVFLPKGSKPPYQVVTYFGDARIHDTRRVEDLGGAYKFIVLAGRAVAIPVLVGTLERGPSEYLLPANQDRERNLTWSTETSRSLDYLETREDIDIQKLGAFGLSSGAIWGVRMLAVDSRFKAAVLSSGGLSTARTPAPEVDPFNFAPRVRIPVLMLNGRDDFMLPYETSQRPLFEALGTKQKELKRYDGGHDSVAMRPDLMREILDWFDRYLGPVSPGA